MATYDTTFNIEGTGGGAFIGVTSQCAYDGAHYKPWITAAPGQGNSEGYMFTTGNPGCTAQVNSKVMGAFRQLCYYSKATGQNPNLVAGMCQTIYNKYQFATP